MPASIICDRKLSLLSKPVTTKHPVPRHEEDLQSATTRFKKREQDRDKVVVRGRWYLEKGGEGQAVSPLYLVRGPHATKLETERARAREKLVRGPHATQLPLKPHLKSQFHVWSSA